MSVSLSPTRIASHTKVFADIGGAGDLVIDGTCKGDVNIRGRVSVQGQGVLKGRIYAREIEVQGVVIGALSAERSILLGPNARVIGALTAPRIEVVQGAQFQGPVQSRAPEPFQPKPAPVKARRCSDEVEETVVTPHLEMQSVAACI